MAWQTAATDLLDRVKINVVEENESIGMTRAT